MTDAKQLSIAGGDLRIILPGTWVRVPLDSQDVATAFAKRLIKQQMGSADRLARSRREAVQELVSSAREAVGIGVHTYLMSLEILPGVPFPSALLLRDEPWPDESREHAAAGDFKQALAVGFPGSEVANRATGPVARRWEMARHSVGEGDDAEVFLTLRLEYFLAVPGGAGVLMARANVSNIPGAEPFATLFDEIIDSITFPEPEPDPAAQATEAEVSQGQPVGGPV